MLIKEFFVLLLLGVVFGSLLWFPPERGLHGCLHIAERGK